MSVVFSFFVAKKKVTDDFPSSFFPAAWFVFLPFFVLILRVDERNVTD